MVIQLSVMGEVFGAFIIYKNIVKTLDKPSRMRYNVQQ